MVDTPWLLALGSMAAPDAESRLTIARTVTPWVIIWSAMVCICDLSPLALSMTTSTPAALNAASRFGRSADSHRADDLVSGRMTPTLPALAALPLLLLLELLPPPPLFAELLPQALMVRATPTSPATAM